MYGIRSSLSLYLRLLCGLAALSSGPELLATVNIAVTNLGAGQTWFAIYRGASASWEYGAGLVSGQGLRPGIGFYGTTYSVYEFSSLAAMQAHSGGVERCSYTGASDNQTLGPCFLSGYQDNSYTAHTNWVSPATDKYYVWVTTASGQNYVQELGTVPVGQTVDINLNYGEPFTYSIRNSDWQITGGGAATPPGGNNYGGGSGSGSTNAPDGSGITIVITNQYNYFSNYTGWGGTDLLDKATFNQGIQWMGDKVDQNGTKIAAGILGLYGALTNRGEGTGSTGYWGTNQISGISNRIAETLSTLARMSNMLFVASNLMVVGTNTALLESNAAGALNIGSNGYAGGLWWVISNYQAEWEKGGGSNETALSNLTFAYSSGLTGPVSSAGGQQLEVTFGQGRWQRTINFDLLSGFFEKIRQFGLKFYAWAVWGLTVVFWVMCWTTMIETIENAYSYAAASSTAPAASGTIGAILARFGLAAVVSAVVTFLLAAVPTALYAWIVARGGNPFTFSIADKVAEGMGDAAVTPFYIRAWYIMQDIIPWGYAISLALNYLLFRSLCYKVYCACMTGLRMLRIRAGVLVVGLGLGAVYQVDAAIVECENWTGAVLSVSNSGVVFAWPIGASSAALPAGTWSNGAGGTTAAFLVPAAGTVKVRFWIGGYGLNGATNDCVATTTRSAEDLFLLGFGAGFAIFGTAWTVSVVRRGLFLRWNYAGETGG